MLAGKLKSSLIEREKLKLDIAGLNEQLKKLAEERDIYSALVSKSKQPYIAKVVMSI
jgi:cell division protein FtsB